MTGFRSGSHENRSRAHLLNLLCHGQLNGVGNELGVLLDDLLDLLLLNVLELILLEEEADFGTTAEGRVGVVESDGEGAAGSRLPDVLFVVIVLRDDLHALGHEVCGVETNTELSNHGNISARAERLHEALST